MLALSLRIPNYKKTLISCNELIKTLKMEVSLVNDKNEPLHNFIADTESQQDSLSRRLRDVETKNKTADREIKNMKSNFKKRVHKLQCWRREL